MTTRMSDNTLKAALCCCILAFAVNHTREDSVLCLACSYTFAGDGTIDFECVRNASTFSKTSAVNCTTGKCQIRTVYTTDYKRLNSLSRGCDYSANNKYSRTCDKPSEVYPTCEVTCLTKKCNDQYGDMWSSIENDGGGGRVETGVRVCIILSLIMFGLMYSS